LTNAATITIARGLSRIALVAEREGGIVAWVARAKAWKGKA
jgi:hypothetical protein